jgi:hypothetical protein
MSRKSEANPNGELDWSKFGGIMEIGLVCLLAASRREGKTLR